MRELVDPRRFELRQTLLAVALFAVIFSLSSLYLYRNHLQLLNATLNHHTEEQQRVWTSILLAHNRGLQAYFHGYVMQQPVLDILRQAQTPDQRERAIARVKLYRELHPVYEQLKREGVRQFHFHHPDNLTLLRFHLPQHASDSLVGVRETVELANRTLQPVHGFEGGRSGNGFRNVFPIIDRDQHLGSVELSQPFEALRSSMAALYEGSEFTLLIRKSEESRLFVEQSRLYAPSPVDPAWLTEDPKGELHDSVRPLSANAMGAISVLRGVDGFAEALDQGVAASFVVEASYFYYVVTTTPIFDVKDHLSAVLVAFHVSASVAQVYQNLAVDLTLSLFFSFLLALALSFIVNRVLKVQEQQRRIAAITDAVESGIYVMGKNGNTIFVNRRAEEILGYKAQELLGVSAHELFHESTMSKFDCPIFQVVISGNKYQNEETFIRKNGDRFPVAVASAPVTLTAGERGAVVVFDDITEQKRLEAQLLHVQKMETVGTLAGGIAHDFNNILSSVNGFTWLTLSKMEGDNPLRRNLERVMEATERAASLTRDLLLFSRKQPGHVQPFDLNNIFTKAEEFWRRTLGSDIVLQTAPAAIALPVRGDLHQIQQVLMNLIINARDAMPQGGEVVVRSERKTLSEGDSLLPAECRAGDYALLQVSDNGSGIEPEVVAHIFEPFFTTKSADKGTGLGLAVAYGIIRQHKGFLRVETAPGQGAKFTVYLPLTSDTVAPPGAEMAELTPAPGGTETILLAEDDKLVRGALTEILTEAGYRVVPAVDGEDALQRFSEMPDRIDLLLFDIIMPRLNGRDAADRINELRPGTKVLFLSGYAPEALRLKIDLDRSSRILNKPPKSHELLRAIRDVLDS